MSAESTKAFATIRDDYAFFESHATEAENDLAHYRSLLIPVVARDQVRLLDFGCGPGGFSSRLLGALGIDPEKLHLTLVEPDTGYLQSAVEMLRPFSGHPISALDALPESEQRFDVVVSNHVFYYVPAPMRMLQRIVSSLDPGGIFLLTMAGRDNVLITFWLRAFEFLGQPMPYNTAETIADVFNELAIPFERVRSNYQLTFPDSEENRMKILRFLLTNHLPAFPRAEALNWFDPYLQNGEVVIRTGHTVYVVRR